MPKRMEVERWLAAYDNPMKPVVLAIRDVVLGADSRIDECIKWQAPTFTFAGNLASFFPKSKQHASLMFHRGAEIPGRHPRLEGTGDTSRVLKLASVAEVTRAKKDIEAIVRAWIAWKDADAAPKATAKKPAPKKPAPKKPAKKKPAKKKPAKKTTAKKTTATRAKSAR